LRALQGTGNANARSVEGYDAHRRHHSGFAHRHTMHDYQDEFIRLALARNALRFGEFTLKSGRVSPYFFNAGAFDDGASLAVLGRCYAEAIMRSDRPTRAYPWRQPRLRRCIRCTDATCRSHSIARKRRTTAKAAPSWAASSKDAC
jgi:hypothetical protein